MKGLPTLQEIKNRTSIHREEYRELESRLSKFYGKPLYWVCHKYDIRKVKQAFHLKQKEGDTNFTHLLQALKTI